MENEYEEFDINPGFQRLKLVNGNISTLQISQSESTSTSQSSINKSNIDDKSKKTLNTKRNSPSKNKNISNTKESQRIYKKSRIASSDSFSSSPFKKRIPEIESTPCLQKKTSLINEFVNRSPAQKKLCFENNSFYTPIKQNNTFNEEKDKNKNNIFINLEEILLFEKETIDIINCISIGNQCYDECFEWWNFYFNSSFCNKLQQYFIDAKSKEIIQLCTNIQLLSVIICYDLSFNYNIFCKMTSCLKEIMNYHHQNLLLISKYILSKVISPGNNEWVQKLSNLLKSYIVFNANNFNSNIIQIINNNCINITNIQRVILKNYNENSPLINDLTYIFKKISIININDINIFFRIKVIRVFNKNGSILASSTNKSEFIKPKIQVPYLNEESLKKYTLVLDLDETLIHFKVDPIDDSKGILQFRPGLFEFLEKIGKYYEIIVFTAATKEYADPIIDEIEQNKIYFDYRLYREHTVIVENDFVKDISKLGRDLAKMIIVDNMPQSFELQKENGIFIRPFWGKDQEDYALIDLIPILINIANEGCDVREGLKFYKDDIINKVTSNFYRKQMC